ncbi:MAG: M6 family metalloprotease domain-containing protein, partial [candidate division Zixibacteria bacterium]|nr:M6 family metalloprotease domain-containing protein [candidate division Zixibacteria bacterium]
MAERGAIIITATTIAAVFLLTATTVAMPPHPAVVEAIEQGGELPYALAHRDELLQRGVDAAGAAPAVKAMAKQATGTATSQYKLLCILVEFADNPATVAAADFDSLLFSQQSPSVRHYYNEVSYGTIDIVTVNLPSSLGWQSAPQSYSYYVNGASGLGSYPQNCQKLVEDLVNLVDGVVNFADYDNDNDGWVDGLTLIHAGKGAEAESNPGQANNMIWSHKWATYVPMSKDGKLVYIYSIQPEYVLSAGDATIGVHCHELGHSIFGLPDLYDTDYSSCGLGKWSIMAAGSWNGPNSNGGSPAHFDAWCRLQCGFTTANNVTANVNSQIIPRIETDSTGIFRLWSNGAASSEYFLIENRQQVGYDTYVPGSGLLIYHIDDAVSTDNDNEWYPGHTYNGHYLVALEQADNLYQLEKDSSYGDDGDPFPGSSGQTLFSNITFPSSRSYSGSNTLVAVNNISSSAAIMTTDLVVALVADVDDYISDPILP